MPPLVLLAIQIVASFVVLGLFAITVAIPRLRALPAHRAAVPLLWVHTLRYAPLALLAPGQTGPEVSREVAHTIAWGDAISAAFAVAALIAIHVRGPRGLSWVWAFSAISATDIVVALSTGLGSGVYLHALGVGWYVLTLYVPLVCIAQVLIGWVLLRRSA